MVVRPEYETQFVERATDIRQRMLDNLPDEWRKEKGDFVYDAIGANPAEVIQLEMQQDRILQNTFPQYCEDAFLDLHLQLRGLHRIQATYSVRTLEVEADPGVRIAKGYRLTSIVLDGNGDPIEFAANEETVFTEADPLQQIRVTCLLCGLVGNIPNGSEFISQPPIPGIRRITDMGTTIPATDKESTDVAWTRYLDKVINPNTGGNVNDYRRWIIQDIQAVKKVIVEPLWAGRGTVRVVCVGADYQPCTPEVVDMVQEYIDPIPFQGYAYGKAPMGAVVTVITGIAKHINIGGTLMCRANADRNAILAVFRNRVTEYLQSITFEIDPKTKALYPVAYNKIGSFLITIDGVENYSGLTLNGEANDIALIPYDIPTLGEVVLDE